MERCMAWQMGLRKQRQLLPATVAISNNELRFFYIAYLLQTSIQCVCVSNTAGHLYKLCYIQSVLYIYIYTVLYTSCAIYTVERKEFKDLVMGPAVDSCDLLTRNAFLCYLVPALRKTNSNLCAFCLFVKPGQLLAKCVFRIQTCAIRVICNRPNLPVDDCRPDRQLSPRRQRLARNRDPRGPSDGPGAGATGGASCPERYEIRWDSVLCIFLCVEGSLFLL